MGLRRFVLFFASFLSVSLAYGELPEPDPGMTPEIYFETYPEARQDFVAKILERDDLDDLHKEAYIALVDPTRSMLKDGVANEILDEGTLEWFYWIPLVPEEIDEEVENTSKDT